MPTLLDSLVIQLNLDGKNVAKGAQQAGKSLKTLEGQAGHTAGTLSEAGKTAADGFSRARTEALALLAVFTGGRSLKAFTSEITRTNAELGYTAQRLNMDPGNLYRMQRAVEAVGGSASEVGSSFQSMQQALTDPAHAAQLQNTMGQLGLRANDYVDAHGNIQQDILKRLNRSTQGMNQAAKNSLLQSLGMGPGEINEINLTTRAFDKLQAQLKDTAPTPQQIRDSQQLLSDWTAMTAETEKLGRSILGYLMPGIDKAVTSFTAWEKANEPLAKEIGETALAVGGLITILGGLATAKGLLMLFKIPGALKNASALKDAMFACDCEGGPGASGAKKGENAALTASEKTAKETAEAGARKGASKALPEMGTYLAKGADASGLIFRKWALRQGLRAIPIAGELYDLYGGALNKGESAAVDRLRARGAFGNNPFGKYSAAVAGIESGGRYDIMGGAGGKYAGKYQMSRDAINDAAKRLHEDAPSTDQFLKDPGMQERYFRAYTDMNRAYLSSHDATFSKLSENKQLAILGYAHNQGAGGALKWLHGGAVGHDAFGTAGTRYSDAISAALMGPDQQVAQNKTEIHVGDIHVTAHGNANGQQIARDVHTELKRILPHTAATGLA
ncbi:hypothetical protein [Gluconobacter sp. Gdi]|uniref:hypothetical protein n=1 Tax=Gluconobacter sp. Gdi TaxID=2691888 RepID=UPI001756061C|nr:hypothetical protein [Gluconobacter sp. Gdi]GFE96582.1 hypothetical protein DmGdi_16550 [Gluconobacter sp. Gdi]